MEQEGIVTSRGQDFKTSADLPQYLVLVSRSTIIAAPSLWLGVMIMHNDRSSKGYGRDIQFWACKTGPSLIHLDSRGGCFITKVRDFTLFEIAVHNSRYLLPPFHHCGRTILYWPRLLLSTAHKLYNYTYFYSQVDLKFTHIDLAR